MPLLQILRSKPKGSAQQEETERLLVCCFPGTLRTKGCENTPACLLPAGLLPRHYFVSGCLFFSVSQIVYWFLKCSLFKSYSWFWTGISKNQNMLSHSLKFLLIILLYVGLLGAVTFTRWPAGSCDHVISWFPGFSFVCIPPLSVFVWFFFLNKKCIPKKRHREKNTTQPSAFHRYFFSCRMEFSSIKTVVFLTLPKCSLFLV